MGFLADAEIKGLQLSAWILELADFASFNQAWTRE